MNIELASPKRAFLSSLLPIGMKLSNSFPCSVFIQVFLLSGSIFWNSNPDKDIADDSADEADESEGDESWQGDAEVDWENPEDIGEGAEWNESDEDSEQ